MIPRYGSVREGVWHGGRCSCYEVFAKAGDVWIWALTLVVVDEQP